MEETRSAGTDIELDVRVEDVEDVPAPLGRDAYRIVQEALTNVSKHAGGAPARVRITGAPGEGLHISVRNRQRSATFPQTTLPGAGAGLSVTRTLLSHFSPAGASERHHAAAQQLDGLTDRELEVALAVGEGASNAEIAASLFMSEATVKAHVSRLLGKLGVNNRVQVAIVVHDAAQAGGRA